MIYGLDVYKIKNIPVFVSLHFCTYMIMNQFFRPLKISLQNGDVFDGVLAISLKKRLFFLL